MLTHKHALCFFQWAC